MIISAIEQKLKDQRQEIKDLKQENFIVTEDLIAMKKKIEPIYEAYHEVVGNRIVKNPGLSHIIRIVVRFVMKSLKAKDLLSESELIKQED